MSRRKKLDAPLLEPFLLDIVNPRHLRPDQVPVSPPRLDWKGLFGRTAPLEIEVGFGKGMFLVNTAKARPEVDFLGIEIERKYTLDTAARLLRQGVPNVKLAATDARWLLTTGVHDSSVDAVHVYFPDPWWKKRHKKRKVFTADFASQVARVLKPRGMLWFKTDVQDYFDETLPLVSATGAFIEKAWPNDEAWTNFERKYREEGRPIYRAAFAARDSDGS